MKDLLTMKESGEANVTTIMEKGNWAIAIRLNGEFSDEWQNNLTQEIVGSVNFCREAGIYTVSEGKSLGNLIEVAQCVWEAVNDRLGGASNDDVVEKIRESIGTAELRGQLRDVALLNACDKGWDIVSEERDELLFDNFDWEFVPWFLDNCVYWDTETSNVSLRDNWKEICQGKAGEEKAAA